MRFGSQQSHTEYKPFHWWLTVCWRFLQNLFFRLLLFIDYGDDSSSTSARLPSRLGLVVVLLAVFSLYISVFFCAGLGFCRRSVSNENLLGSLLIFYPVAGHQRTFFNLVLLLFAALLLSLLLSNLYFWDSARKSRMGLRQLLISKIPAPLQLVRPIFSLLGAICKSDGRVSPSEISRVELYLDDEWDLNFFERQEAMRAFRSGVQSLDFEKYCGQISRFLVSHPQAVLGAIEVLRELMGSDSEMTPQKRMVMQRVFRSLGSLWGSDSARDSAQHYRERPRFQQQAQRPDTQLKHAELFATLGCAPTAPASELKRAYRAKCKELHPDSTLARGLPRKVIELNIKKFRDLQSGWENLCAERKDLS